MPYLLYLAIQQGELLREIPCKYVFLSDWDWYCLTALQKFDTGHFLCFVLQMYNWMRSYSNFCDSIFKLLFLCYRYVPGKKIKCSVIQKTFYEQLFFQQNYIQNDYQETKHSFIFDLGGYQGTCITIFSISLYLQRLFLGYNSDLDP